MAESPAPIRVAHCIHGLGLGGAQQVIKGIVARGDRGAFRHFVYSCEDGVFRAPIEAAGAGVRIIARRVPKFDPLWAVGLSRALRADAIEIVHTHLFGDSLHGYLAARIAGRLPVVMTLHNAREAHSPLQQRGYRWLLARATRSIACTPSSARSFAPLAARAGVRLDTIANGIDVPGNVDLHPVRRAALRAQLGIAPAAPVVGALGRLVEQKGFAYLIRAFAQVLRDAEPGARLVLLGEGPLEAALREQARRDGVAASVVFAGFRADAAAMLHAFDVVAFSSLFEGLSIALLEAMAAARCIVGTTAAGIADAITDGREGLLVPPRDPDRLAAALARAFGDGGLRRQLGEAARRRFQSEFTATRMVAAYERLYREVIAAPGGAAGTRRCGAAGAGRE